MIHEIRDITILGGGPTGLFAMFYAGMRGATSQIVDALPDLGGQLTALYPEKYIFDVAGFPKILAKELVHKLAEQAHQFRQPVHLAQRVTALREVDGHFVIDTANDSFPTRSVLIAAGIGAFTARKLPQPCAAEWYDRGIHDRVLNPEELRGKKVTDFALTLPPLPMLLHRPPRVARGFSPFMSCTTFTANPAGSER
jgi:thioredoxin reductase